jgi:hypothetical protein
MIRLILTFERAGVVAVDVPVDNARQGAGHDHSQMKHN